MPFCLFFAYLFSADFRRGGKGNCPMEYSQFIEMHNNCTKALINEKAKMPSQNIDVDTGLFGQYAKFQVSFPARLVYLRSGNFQESVEPGRDKCVPPLLQRFSAKIKSGGA